MVGIRGNVNATRSAVGQLIRGPPPSDLNSYDGIVGDVTSPETQGQIFESMRQQGKAASQPLVERSNARSSAATPPRPPASTPGPPPARPTILDATPQLTDLLNDNPRDLLHITCKGMTLPLWKIERIQTQYGVFQPPHPIVPWCILGFRLKKGEDKNRSVRVEVKGTLESHGATIKGIWPRQTANSLSRFPTTQTRQTQFKIGVDMSGKALTSFGLTEAVEHLSETGQTLLPSFTKEAFEVVLGVDKGSPRGTYVAELVEFFVLLQLEEERQPVTMQITSAVLYKSYCFWTQEVSASKVLVSSGKEEEDIRRG
ncbi:hypothetical protein DXG01_001142 [Tephrocybe rancida]|nr:hypothetical protein DXG01_001142 [Tephrocybe rancida]